MSIFNQFPWTNYREYNLDWVIRTVKDCKDTVDAALADVSNAVALYFQDHIDTSLTQSGDAADAATVGSRLTTVNNSITNHTGRIQTLESNMIYVYRFTSSGGTMSPGSGVNVADIISNWEDHEPFMIIVDDLEAYNIGIQLVTGYLDRWIIDGAVNNQVFRFETYTNTGTISMPSDTAKIVRIKGTSGSYSYGTGDYDTAYDIIHHMLTGSESALTETGVLMYQQSLSTDAYMLKSCKISGTNVLVTFTNDLALTLASDGTIS